jgi:hypothetical protein
VLKEICAKWSKFSEQDESTLKSNEDLVTQVVAKYGFDQAQAKREVDALMKGRQIGAGPRAHRLLRWARRLTMLIVLEDAHVSM